MHSRFPASQIGMLVAAGFVLAACGQGEQIKAAKEAAEKTAAAVKQIDTKKLEEAAKKMEAASKQLEAAQKSGDANATADAMKAMNTAMTGATGEPVDFRELRALLPETLPAMKRVSVEGQKGGAMGVNVSNAKAEYRSEDEAKNQSVRLEISDMAGMGPMATLAFAWANVEIDKETQDGYEKTATMNGRRVMEKFSKSGQRGEITTLVGNRFVVAASSSNIDMAALKAVVNGLDLAKLEKMKGPAVAAK